MYWYWEKLQEWIRDKWILNLQVFYYAEKLYRIRFDQARIRFNRAAEQTWLDTNK